MQNERLMSTADKEQAKAIKRAQEEPREYQMSDGLVCKTKNDRSQWHTGDGSEVLHCTRRGTYWLEHLTGRHGAWAEYLDKVRAAMWIIEKKMKLPTDLEGLVERITGGKQ